MNKVQRKKILNNIVKKADSYNKVRSIGPDEKKANSYNKVHSISPEVTFIEHGYNGVKFGPSYIIITILMKSNKNYLYVNKGLAASMITDKLKDISEGISSSLGLKCNAYTTQNELDFYLQCENFKAKYPKKSEKILKGGCTQGIKKDPNQEWINKDITYILADIWINFEFKSPNEYKSKVILINSNEQKIISELISSNQISLSMAVVKREGSGVSLPRILSNTASSQSNNLPQNNQQSKSKSESKPSPKKETAISTTTNQENSESFEERGQKRMEKVLSQPQNSDSDLFAFRDDKENTPFESEQEVLEYLKKLRLNSSDFNIGTLSVKAPSIPEPRKGMKITSNKYMKWFAKKKVSKGGDLLIPTGNFDVRKADLGSIYASHKNKKVLEGVVLLTGLSLDEIQIRKSKDGSIYTAKFYTKKPVTAYNERTDSFSLPEDPGLFSINNDFTVRFRSNVFEPHIVDLFDNGTDSETFRNIDDIVTNTKDALAELYPKVTEKNKQYVTPIYTMVREMYRKYRYSTKVSKQGFEIYGQDDNEKKEYMKNYYAQCLKLFLNVFINPYAFQVFINGVQSPEANVVDASDLFNIETGKKGLGIKVTKECMIGDLPISTNWQVNPNAFKCYLNELIPTKENYSEKTEQLSSIFRDRVISGLKSQLEGIKARGQAIQSEMFKDQGSKNKETAVFVIGYYNLFIAESIMDLSKDISKFVEVTKSDIRGETMSSKQIQFPMSILFGAIKRILVEKKTLCQYKDWKGTVKEHKFEMTKTRTKNCSGIKKDYQKLLSYVDQRLSELDQINLT